MAYVTPREGENPESLVNRFRASVQHSGILRELKDRRFFRSKAQKERLAAQRAARRRHLLHARRRARHGRPVCVRGAQRILAPNFEAQLEIDHV